MWRELGALTKSGNTLGVRSFYSGVNVECFSEEYDLRSYFIRNSEGTRRLATRKIQDSERRLHGLS